MKGWLINTITEAHNGQKNEKKGGLVHQRNQTENLKQSFSVEETTKTTNKAVKATRKKQKKRNYNKQRNMLICLIFTVLLYICYIYVNFPGLSLLSALLNFDVSPFYFASNNV